MILTALQNSICWKISPIKKVPDSWVAHCITSELLQETFVFIMSEQIWKNNFYRTNVRFSVASKVKSDLDILYASYTKVHTSLHPLRWKLEEILEKSVDKVCTLSSNKTKGFNFICVWNCQKKMAFLCIYCLYFKDIFL